MAKQEKNVVGLAKGTTKATTPKKRPTPKERAKATVGELLELADDDVVTQTKSKADVQSQSTDNQKSVKWLEEQIELLTKENEELRKKTAQPAPPAGGSGRDGIIKLFNEFQTEYLRHQPQFRTRTDVNLGFVIRRMIEEIPFLQQHRRI